jgi:hypothetical protein
MDNEIIAMLVQSNTDLTNKIEELTKRLPKPEITTISRADFDKLGPPERHRLIVGGKVTVYDY